MLISRLCPRFDADGAAAGGGAGGDAGTDAAAGGKIYDEGYVKALRQEAAANRVKASDLQKQIDELPGQITGKLFKALGMEADPNKAYEQQIQEAQTKAQAATALANTKLIRGEVKFLSAELGVVDPDAAFALMDQKDVKVDDQGNVTGVKDALTALLKDWPYLKGQPGSGAPPIVGGSSNPGAGNPGTGSGMNDFIRRAAGR